MELRLDTQTFKALSSETRVEILKLLGARRHTQSEIASRLSMSAPTVKEHLAALSKAGLVESHDEGRKWKYFSLSKKGRGVLYPQELRIWIVLSALVFSVVGGILTYPTQAPVAQMKMAAEAMTMAAQPVQEFSLYPVFVGIACVLLIIAASLIVLQRYHVRRLGKRLTKK